jgi:hypothetical protein
MYYNQKEIVDDLKDILLKLLEGLKNEMDLEVKLSHTYSRYGFNDIFSIDIKSKDNFIWYKYNDRNSVFKGIGEYKK